MTHATGTYDDFETLREQALALRREGLSRRQIRDRIHVDNNDLLNRLLEGEPPPDWTGRPNAKDDLRDRARELRLQGWTYDRIQIELGCSKSSISLWVRDLPKPARPDTSERAKLAARKRWEHESATREAARRQTKDTARRAVGPLSDRELFLTGVALYWAEGTKDKPHARRETVTFVNSDPGMIQVFLAWLDLLGVDRDRLRFGVLIHESADVPDAEKHWAGLTGAPRSAFYKTTLKKHNPKTVRKNVGERYRGCLVIKVRQSADLYRRIEGAWYGIVGAVLDTDISNRT
ncbi:MULTISPECIES: hypothetical protein [unclassified Streptomyces]|uniref:hypothetical protein n=1 Tax=unclassified Streptomyces TaxID=2593676 RepID=UPI000DBA9B28|nr:MULTISPECIES: hypothetical protein [unclassified Streptomyces]MYT72642.1 hypothetical protein [Streptomyces sp. SID8367]RAJ79499.1 hypothetical protein K377_05219 [Streptomyces sp. PsTaAH-137]